jgi:hypothetical protein
MARNVAAIGDVVCIMALLRYCSGIDFDFCSLPAETETRVKNGLRFA